VQIEDGSQVLKPYSLGAGNGSGSALLFCLMPVLNEDDEFRQKFQEFTSHYENGWADMLSIAICVMTEILPVVGMEILTPSVPNCLLFSIRPIEDLPKISDITMHPPSVYMMLTGEYDESKTEDDVLQKLIEIAGE